MTVPTGEESSRKRCPKCDRAYPLQERYCAVDGEPLSLPDPYHLVGRTIAEKYRIEALAGMGGMGAVYSAWHLTIGRRVAVKILQPNIALVDARMVSLFEREARTVGRLVHDNICDILDAGRTADGIAYSVMEWLDGRTLEEELANHRTLSLDATAELLRQIASALDTAHAADVIHRDLKPSNVVLQPRPDGRVQVKVVDFGIAKAVAELTVSSASLILGTPAYASPEQYGTDRRVDARSDIYSLGVIVYRALTGELPYAAASLDELIRLKATAAPKSIAKNRPDVPAAVNDVVQRMLARDPDARPPTASQASAQFDAACEEPVSADSDQTPTHAVSRSALRTRHGQRALGADAITVVEPAVEPHEGSNPLLSELDALPPLHRWIERHRGGWAPAALATASGSVALALSVIVRADCIRLTFEAQPSAARRELLFGYAAEPNAGLWYLVGVPVFVLAAWHFLNLAWGALRELAEAERLVVAGGAPNGSAATLDWIHRANRRLFRLVTPALVVLAAVGVVVPEYVASPRPIFGWVDALHIRDYRGASLRALEANKQVGAVPAIDALCAGAAGCDIRIVDVAGGHGAGDARRWRIPFALFLFVGLGQQAVFGAFGLWIVAKIVFLFAILARALVGRRNGLRIRLDFEDTEMRFGLGALDAVYNAILTMVLIASTVFLLQRISNVAKGTSFFGGMATLSFISQLGLFLFSLLPLAVVLVVPIAVFMILVETQVGRAIAAVERERVLLKRDFGGDTPRRQKILLERAEDKLRHRRDRIRSQRPWPRRNSVYRLLLAACVAMLVVLPFTIEYGASSGALPILVRGSARLSEILCWLL
jgi:serine/threonine protein kinase